MKELVNTIVKELVDNPEKVEVAEIEGSQSLLLELKVAKEDNGKVIGKQGRIANAIRILLNASTDARKKRVSLEIIE